MNDTTTTDKKDEMAALGWKECAPGMYVRIEPLRQAWDRIRQLEDALRPFADLDTVGAAEYVAAGIWREDERFHYLVAVRDLIRAHKVLEGHYALGAEVRRAAAGDLTAVMSSHNERETQ